MQIRPALLTLSLCLFCSGCFIPPREGPPPKYEPWLWNLGTTFTSGFKTFQLDPDLLREGRKYSSGGGYGVSLNGDTQLLGRRNAAYKFGIYDDAEQGKPTFYYEIREINQCTETRDTESEWKAISSIGEVNKVINEGHHRFGTVRLYERKIEGIAVSNEDALVSLSKQPNKVLGKFTRVEAGVLFSFENRVYNLLAFELVSEKNGNLVPSDIEQRFNFLRLRRDRILANINISKGQSDMCHVLTTFPEFGR